jgi:hypothetical protein
LWENDPETWWMFIETNINGPFFMACAVTPGMIARGCGRIIHIAINHEPMRRRGFSLYGPSKAALEFETIIRTRQKSMKTHHYAGWLCEDTSGSLCLRRCPMPNSHEPPLLADIIAVDWKSGDDVCLRCCICPDLGMLKFIGELTFYSPAVLVGVFDVCRELEVYSGKFAVVSVSTLPDDVCKKLERQR